MSCPTVLISKLDGVETGRVAHNWGWVSPSYFEVGMRIVRIVTGQYTFYDGKRLGEFDSLYIPMFGTLTKEKYSEMYYDLKNIVEYKLPKNTFDIRKYIVQYKESK